MPRPLQLRLAAAIVNLGERAAQAAAHVSYLATLASLRTATTTSRVQVLIVGATLRASTAVAGFDLRAELGRRLDAWIEGPYRDRLRGELRFRGRAGVTIVPAADQPDPSTVDDPPRKAARAPVCSCTFCEQGRRRVRELEWAAAEGGVR